MEILDMDVVKRKIKIIIGAVGLLGFVFSLLIESAALLLVSTAAVIVTLIAILSGEKFINYKWNFLMLGAGFVLFLLMDDDDWLPVILEIYAFVTLDFFLQHFLRFPILSLFPGIACICIALAVRPLNIGCGLLMFVGVWLLGRNLVKISNFFQKKKITKYEDAYQQDLIAYYADQPLTQELYMLLQRQPHLLRVTLCYNSVQYADYQNINNPQNCLFSNLGEGFGNLTDDFHIYACGMALLAKLGDGFAIRDEGSQSALVIVRQE